MDFTLSHKLNSGKGPEIIAETEVDLLRERVSFSLTLPWVDSDQLDQLLLDTAHDTQILDEKAWDRAREIEREKREAR